MPNQPGNSSFSQINFDKELSLADPVKKTDTISTKKKLVIHDAFLKKAIANKNLQQQFFGHLYLWSDYLVKNDYESATLQLFTADSIAQQSGNLSWQAAVLGKKGILAFELNEIESALKNSLLALEYCHKTIDSSCLAINLKEVALAYQRLQKYDSAKYYFDLALPSIRKYSDSTKLFAYYSNYSNLLKDMGDYAGCKSYLDSAMEVVMQGNDLLKQSACKNNLAAYYVNIGEYEKALKILKESVLVNKQHGWYELLSFNYANLSEIYDKKGDFRLAFKYLQDYYSIDDSLKGVSIKLKTAGLNAIYEPQSKERELEKQQLVLLDAHQTITIGTFILFLISLLVLIGLVFWRVQLKKNKHELSKNKDSLNELTHLLLQKNTMLSQMEEELVKSSAIKIQEAEIIDFDSTLYNQNILTNDDWMMFKIRFEKAYPGYLLKLRTTYPELTEAKERLFLFIKLKFKTKEIASILGISVDSVKKTRQRLRKRLDLAEDVDLDDFIMSF